MPDEQTNEVTLRGIWRKITGQIWGFMIGILFTVVVGLLRSCMT
jgi:tetrahydromethanopterin S-methyltransferase subunit G